MDRSFRSLLPVAALAVSALSTTAALAQSKDAQAKKLEAQAMDEDYLATNFAAAEAKIQQAIKLCGAKACSPQVLARLHVSLGTVLGGGENKLEAAKIEFLDALKIDPTVKLDKDLTTPELQFTFDEAKNQLAGGAAGAATPPTQKAIAHTPVAEQALNTPVPVYVELPAGLAPAAVTVKYKAPGRADWKGIDLKKVAQGWGGLIPCADVATEGDLEYYVLATDESDAVLLSGGSRAKPYRVPIRDEITAEAPHLPGQPPPDSCVKKAKPAPAPKPVVEEKILPPCESDRECDEGMICSSSGKCEPKPEGWQPPEAASEAKKNWVGIVGAPDLALISGDDVCTPDAYDNRHFSCVYSNGQEYQPNAVNPLRGRADNIQPGVAPSTIRVIANYDRLIGHNFLAGIRLGFAFNGGPSGFLPLHAEARGSWFLGKDPFARTGVRPFVFAAAGLAQVDTRVGVEVREDASVVPCDNAVGGECKRNLDAWHRSGLAFAGVGVGAQYAVTKAQALVIDVKLSEMFPATATVISPEIGFVTGF